MTKDTLEMAKELGLNEENIKAGLKADKKTTEETVKKAYDWKKKIGAK